MHGDKDFLSLGEVKLRLDEMNKFDVCNYIQLAEDGKLKIDLQGLHDDPCAAVKRMQFKSDDVQKLVFFNGQSISFDRNGFVAELKTTKHKRYQ